jgi:hydroxymethylpyrimidine pyrophosphatase-like HAD family hydrolase
VRDLPINVPAVICNGAAIYDFQKNEYLEVALLDADALRRGQILMDAFPDVACEAYHIGNTIHTIHPNEVTRHHIHMTHVNVEERTSLLEVPLPLGKLLFEAEHDRLEAALAFMQSNGWTAVYELVFSSPYMLEMTRKDASKGGMIRRLAARLHVDPSHLYCAGDEANDLSMLQVAAEGFAPANCVPAVRKSGATIVADARQNAMADIVSILDQRY